MRRLKHEKSKTDTNSPDYVKVFQVGDLATCRQQWGFNLPDNLLANKIICQPNDRIKVASDLYNSGHLRVNMMGVTKNSDASQDVHSLFTILNGEKDINDNISVCETSLYKFINAAIEKDPLKLRGIWEKTVCVSSVSLLTNILFCKELNWDVTVSADGTDNILGNSYQVLHFGVFSMTDDCRRSFRPFIYIVAPTESSVAFAIGLVTFLKYARRLFNLSNINFNGLFVSDHTGSFVTPASIAFPLTVKASCYPHIIRKFTSMRKGNGMYLSDYDSKKYHFVVRDVRVLNGCLTKVMFDTYAELVRKV